MERQIQTITDMNVRMGAALLLLFAANRAFRQGTLTVINTGRGNPWRRRFLFVDGALVHPRLLFNLGFATDETAAPSAFLDSVTVTMQDANQIFTTIYLAADAAGTLLAPPPPGTVVIDPATISTNAMA